MKISYGLYNSKYKKCGILKVFSHKYGCLKNVGRCRKKQPRFFFAVQGCCLAQNITYLGDFTLE